MRARRAQVSRQVSRLVRWGVCSLTAAIAVTAIAGDAQARGHRHRHGPSGPAAGAYQPPPSSIVVDANTGKVLQTTEADSPRHPASLTKIMTLYLLFERLESGKIKMTTEMPVSPHAAMQAPSKLGLQPGETIKVETAIRAIVTKSANDVAVIVAEALGGDEQSFAKLMTAKARALSMKNTTYFNASGLPNDEQFTTARDQAQLGRAIFDRFPNYYRYFSTRTFDFRGKSIRNHNHLLGRIEGLDGIKTGYVNASGFNIVTSVNRAGRHVVAVVFGGRTASARDARVVGLIESNIGLASAKRTIAPLGESVEVAEQPRDPKEKEQTAALRAVATAAPEPAAPAQGSTDPIKPVAVKTVAVHAGNARGGIALSALPSDSRKLAPAPTGTTNVTTVVTVKGETPALPHAETKFDAKPVTPPGTLGTLSTKVASVASDVPVAESQPAAKARNAGGWMIQVGAFPDEAEAKQRLSAAQNKAKDQLGQADPFTEKVAKGAKAMFRARFAGLEKGQAENACKNLKRSEIPCMVMKN